MSDKPSVQLTSGPHYRPLCTPRNKRKGPGYYWPNFKPTLNWWSPKPFRFLDLPADIRNLIYHIASDNEYQAYLIHKPTRRQRRELGFTEWEEPPSKEPQNSRPFHGLTQVCQLIRKEFRPLYMRHQQVGIHIEEISRYMRDFYPDKAYDQGADLVVAIKKTPADDNPGRRSMDPEVDMEGIELLPLLGAWANNIHFSAIFSLFLGAKQKLQDNPELKDLYRLFGLRVLPDGTHTPCNDAWFSLLTTGALASILVNRRPAMEWVDEDTSTTPAPPLRLEWIPGTVALPPGPPGTWSIRPHFPRPYIRILFKPEFAEDWMPQVASTAPAWWKTHHGFDQMEHFEVRVGLSA
ncbi:hypothetical protein IQ07DRAFT_30385 [Pyrenochaeta sp. DS3sAY3a]|nr:hypothetical protein IQ07DRAFT_30385 [Pyrenochaeta sp. DS3sAY3a]